MKPKHRSETELAAERIIDRFKRSQRFQRWLTAAAFTLATIGGVSAAMEGSDNTSATAEVGLVGSCLTAAVAVAERHQARQTASRIVIEHNFGTLPETTVYPDDWVNEFVSENFEPNQPKLTEAGSANLRTSIGKLSSTLGGSLIGLSAASEISPGTFAIMIGAGSLTALALRSDEIQTNQILPNQYIDQLRN